MPKKVSRKNFRKSPGKIMEFIDRLAREQTMAYSEHDKNGIYFEIFKEMDSLREKEGFSYVVGEMNAYLG